MEYGSRRISQETIDKFWRLHDLVKTMPGQYNVSLAANRLGLAVSTVSRFVSQNPWSKAFKRDEFGMLAITGYLPHPPRDNAPVEETVDKPTEVVYTDFSAPDFSQVLKPLVLSAQEHIRQHTNPGEHIVQELLLSGKEQENYISVLGDAVSKLQEKIRTLRNLPNYGKDEWWLDFYESDS